MKRSLLAMFMVLTMIVVMAQPNPVLAATNENFDSYATGTPAGALTTPGVTFTGPHEIQPSTFPFPPLVNLTGQVLIDLGAGAPLDISFATPQSSYSFVFAIATGPTADLTVDAYLNGLLVSTDTYAGTVPGGGAFVEGNAGTSINFDQLVLSQPLGNLFAIDNLVTADIVVATENVPHISDILINTSSPVVAYDSPAGSQAKLANGVGIVLPNDADSSGYDTYIVTDSTVIDGVTWVAIFLGTDDSFVWVRLDQVQLVGPTP